MNFSDRRTHALLFAIAILTLYLLPPLLLGDNTYVVIHDNLDSGFLAPKLLLDSSTVFASSDTIVPQINMPRVVLGSEFSLWVLLYSLLPPLYAYLTGLTIAHIIGFMGMYLLLKRHFIPEPENEYIAILVSLCFALLPYLPMTGISVAGQPLALFAFLNFRKREQTIRDWLILLGIPFFSSFILSFFFFLTMVGFIWLHDLIKKRDANPKFFLAILFMTLVFVGVEYRLFYSQLFPYFVSHRYEYNWHHTNNIPILRGIRRGILMFMVGNYHAHSLQKYSIGISLVISLAIFIFSKKDREKLRKPFFLLVGSAFLISMYYGFWFTDYVYMLKQAVPLVRIMDFTRFFWMFPMIWHLIFALSLLFITYVLIRHGRKLAYVLILVQVLLCFYMSDFAVEIRRSAHTFGEFFAEQQFREIRDHIGEPQDSYRTISVGMHPSIAQFNGFQTADFYLSNYPVEYKHRFRKVIAGELEKDKELKRYYDEWGSRVYAFSVELRKDWTGTNLHTPIKSLDYDTEAMKELGIKYVISRVPIERPFTFMKRFTHPDSAWDIYLYRVP